MTSGDHPSFDDYEQTNRRPQTELLARNLQQQQLYYRRRYCMHGRVASIVNI
jgi:hypothetical protein